MVRPVAGDLPEQVKNNQSVNMAAGNGGQKMSQYPWFTVYGISKPSVSRCLLSYQNHHGSFPRRLSIASPSTFFVRFSLRWK